METIYTTCTNREVMPSWRLIRHILFSLEQWFSKLNSWAPFRDRVSMELKYFLSNTKMSFAVFPVLILALMV